MNAAEYLLATGQASATALECDTQRLSYGELRAAVAHAAGAWCARGLEQGERVLIFAPDSIAWVIAYLGAIWAGGVAVGLNSRLFERELSVVLSESGARFIWCNESLRALLERLAAAAGDPPRPAAAGKGQGPAMELRQGFRSGRAMRAGHSGEQDRAPVQGQALAQGERRVAPAIRR